jgi:hypothetical protein
MGCVVDNAPREQKFLIIPNATKDDSSFVVFGIARGAGGAAARQK